MRDVYKLRSIVTDLHLSLGQSPRFAFGLLFGLLLTTLLGLAMTSQKILTMPEIAAYWPRDTIDDYAFVSANAKRAGALDEPCVLLVGTAAMREGLLAPDEMGDRLSQGRSTPVCVVNLMAGGQSALEAAALVSEAVSDHPTIVVLGVSPSRMSADSSELQYLVTHPRLAFINEAFHAEALALGLDVPRRSGIHIVDSFEFYGLRTLSFLSNVWNQTSHLNNVHSYDGRPVQSQDAQSQDFERLSARMVTYDERVDENMESYARLMDTTRAETQDTTFVLLDIPINPVAVQGAVSADKYARHIENMNRFCAMNGCIYINPNQHEWLPPEHFHDWSHIAQAPAREIYSAPVIETLISQTQSWEVSN